MKSTLKYLSDLASLHRFSTQAPGYFLVEQKSYGYFKEECTWSLHLRGSTTVEDFSLTSPAARLQFVQVNRAPCIVQKLDFYLDSISSIYQLGSQTSRIAQTLAVY